MSREKKSVVGKVGYCDNKVLNIRNKTGGFSGGHYVYIRTCRNGKCDVNIITSLEDKRGIYQDIKIDKVKRGYLYPIPKSDGNFSQWSAVNLDGNIKGVKLSDIQNIGKKGFKKRHRFFVGKFTKKK